MIELRDEILIAKEPELIWSILSDVSNWGRWCRVMKHAAIYGPMKQGTSFKCIAGKWDFEGKIAALDFGKSIDFDANSIGLMICMHWIFTADSSQTKVTIHTNIDGWIPKLFSKRVRESFRLSINTWLNSLKAKAERDTEILISPTQVESPHPSDNRTVQFSAAISLLFRHKKSAK